MSQEVAELVTQLVVIRHRNGFTQRATAERMGTNQSTVGNLERGRTPSLPLFLRYADAVGARIDIRDLGEDEDE